MPTNEKPLQEELGIFERHRPEWLRSHLGEFVTIAGTNIVGFHPDFESAFKSGLEVAGLGKNFLVKQIWAEEPVYAVY